MPVSGFGHAGHRFELEPLAFDDLDAPPVVVGSRNWIPMRRLRFPQPSWMLDAIHERIMLCPHQLSTNPTTGELVRRQRAGI